MDMKSFLEAAVRTEDSERAVEIIRSRVARQTGQEIYVTKVMDIVIGGDGIKRYGIFMMFADGHHALRLNWKSSDTSASVESISFWVHLSKDPQFEASTKGMNIVQIINRIDDVVAGVDTEQEQVAESILLEAATIGFSDVKALFSKAGYIIDKDPAFTVRRWLVTNRKTGESIPIRYTPTVGEMYNEIRTLGVEGFIDKTRADSGRKVPAESGKIKPAAKEQAIPIQRSPFDSLFEDPLNEKELFGLLSKGVSDVKSGRSKTLIVCGDPGLGKCVHYTLDLPVRFL